MKRFTCSLLIGLLILSAAFAADDKLSSGAVSLYHLASISGIEVSFEQVENIVLERARGPYVANFVIIDAARRIGIELQERNLTYEQLQALETSVIACLRTTLGDEDSEADAIAVANFIVVESATEKSVHVFGASQKSLRGATTVISRGHFLEHWTGQVLALRPALSAEATQLLQEVITATAAHSAKLKSGEIEFSITMHQAVRQRKNALERFLTWGQKKKDETQYEKQGDWHITYRFDGDRHFHDVKMRKKSELNGHPLQNWHEMHLQYRVEGRTWYFREKHGTEWQQKPPHEIVPPRGKDNIPSDIFQVEFNPHWWSWPPWGFKLKRLIHIFKPINVQQVNFEGVPHVLLTLQLTEPNVTLTTEIWLDPQKAYHPTRILGHHRSAQQVFIEGRDGELAREKTYRLTSNIYQFAQFEPNIWFPKAVTMEFSYTINDENKQPPPVYRRTTMQVHRAVFNIPISKKELGITPDR